MAHQVFISYGRSDKPVADAVCARLEGRGIRCWIAPRDVRPGQQYGEALGDAIRDAKALVLVFSSHANQSSHVAKEVEAAVRHGIPLIPFRIEAVDPNSTLGYFINSVHWLDALTPPREQQMDLLAETIERLDIGKRAAPPTSRATAAQPQTGGSRPFTGNRTALAIVSIALIGAVSAIAVWQWMRATPDTRTIAGCWLYQTAPVRMTAEGRVTGIPLEGEWTASDRDHFLIRWPRFVDQVNLSADGRSLAGTNNYGQPQQATRNSSFSGDRRTLSGDWRYNTLPTTASDDGSIVAGPFTGRWSATGVGAFSVEWTHRPIDDVVLSQDGTTLRGTNNYGFPVAATRSACPS
ncbi:MAG: toll/interleukin-1 receptor domain-containing protein [Gemmatimonadaceae bacterium]|nr:toll/interleukin-1 receptor domain-containing protein [Gemmatimonadaceae bacterium]